MLNAWLGELNAPDDIDFYSRGSLLVNGSRTKSKVQQAELWVSYVEFQFPPNRKARKNRSRHHRASEVVNKIAKCCKEPCIGILLKNSWPITDL